MPSKAKINEMDQWFEARDGGIKRGQECRDLFKSFGLSEEFGPELEKWGNDPKIPRLYHLGFFTDFFQWYEVAYTPLYDAMQENE